MAKTETNEQLTATINLIAAGTTINGDITTSGDIRIDGQITGNVHAKGRIVIGTSGQIEGEIRCQNADFSGSVTGKVFVNELLALKASSRIIGDIQTQKISIEPGAVFSGNCIMQANKSE